MSKLQTEIEEIRRQWNDVLTAVGMIGQCECERCVKATGAALDGLRLGLHIVRNMSAAVAAMHDANVDILGRALAELEAGRVSLGRVLDSMRHMHRWALSLKWIAEAERANR